MSNIFEIDVVDSNFVLKGDIATLIGNRRLKGSLKRLEYEENKGMILIPFNMESKIATLNSIRNLLNKFDINVKSGESIKSELVAYHREVESFKEFSEKAIKIKNNEFSDEPQLVEDFKNFKDVLSSGMKRALYDLQMLSAFHLAFSQNACNFAVPGAGKTSIVYGAYHYLKSLPESSEKKVDKLLVIGPISSFAPWEKEYEKCFGNPPSSQRLSGDLNISKDYKQEHLYSNSPKEITLVSHAGIANLRKEIIDFLKRNRVMLVVDEAHRIKNVEGLWGRVSIEIAKEATARVVLTGTPAPNGYEDIFNLIRFIYPFKHQEILQIHYPQLRELTKNSIPMSDVRVQAFVNNIFPYYIRIKKSDLKLPAIREKIILVLMDDTQRKIYDFIEEKYIDAFSENSEGGIKDVLNRAKLIRLRQAATNPSLLIKPIKDSLDVFDNEDSIDFKVASLVNEAIEDIEIYRDIKNFEKNNIPNKFKKIVEVLRDDIFPSGGKAVIWSIFIQNADELQEYLKKEGIISKLLIGRIPQEERESVIERFNNPQDMTFRVIIANPFSVAESISLHHGCHNAIYLERDYNASNFIQSKDRIHRVGLKENQITNYYYLVSAHSIDSVINDKLDEKVERMEKIIDQEIPLFSRVDENDETDLITALLKDYASRFK